MRVVVNGEERELPQGASVADAVAVVGAEPGRGIAIAVDGEVVPSGEIGLFVLREGQRIEIVAAIGGGSR